MKPRSDESRKPLVGLSYVHVEIKVTAYLARLHCCRSEMLQF